MQNIFLYDINYVPLHKIKTKIMQTQTQSLSTNFKKVEYKFVNNFKFMVVTPQLYKELNSHLIQDIGELEKPFCIYKGACKPTGNKIKKEDGKECEEVLITDWMYEFAPDFFTDLYEICKNNGKIELI